MQRRREEESAFVSVSSGDELFVYIDLLQGDLEVRTMCRFFNPFTTKCVRRLCVYKVKNVYRYFDMCSEES